MWSKAFWKATLERMIRGAAVSIGAVWLGGDVVFDAFNLHTWNQVGSLGVSGAFLSLVLSLIGNGVTGNGPSLNNTETVVTTP